MTAGARGGGGGVIYQQQHHYVPAWRVTCRNRYKDDVFFPVIFVTVLVIRYFQLTSALSQHAA